MAPEDRVRALWDLFDGGRFEEVRPLLTEDFEAIWPQTGERIRGPDNFIALNANYPGRWRCRIERLEPSGAGLVSVAEISDDAHRLYAVSFWRFAGDLIAGATEYFGDAGPPPFERSQWTEPL